MIEITPEAVETATKRAAQFWKNLRYLLNDVGCSHATYSFLKRDATLDNAIRTVTYQMGFGKLPSEQYALLHDAVLRGVQAEGAA